MPPFLLESTTVTVRAGAHVHVGGRGQAQLFSHTVTLVCEAGFLIGLELAKMPSLAGHRASPEDPISPSLVLGF